MTGFTRDYFKVEQRSFQKTNINMSLSHIHEHAADGHTHEHLDHPGSFHNREKPLGRDFSQRAFTVGIGGPVGSGKTALMLALCQKLRDKMNIGAVTNDIFTKEDGEFLIRHEALEAARIRAVETGGCPHASTWATIPIYVVAMEELKKIFKTDLILIESGGDNLAAPFSRELADFSIYVIDVAGGDKIPRKGGPGITQADLLVINKTDLAEAVGADLGMMARDANVMRGGGPVVFAQIKHGVGVDSIVDSVVHAWQHAISVPHSH